MDIQCVPAQGDSARFRYKFKPVEHRCTRPFIYDEIVLSNEMKSDGQPAVKNTEESVMKFLEKKIKELVKQAKDDYGDRSPALEKPMVSARADILGCGLGFECGVSPEATWSGVFIGMRMLDPCILRAIENDVSAFIRRWVSSRRWSGSKGLLCPHVGNGCAQNSRAY